MHSGCTVLASRLSLPDTAMQVGSPASFALPPSLPARPTACPPAAENTHGVSGIKQQLEKKEGLFRKNMMGKRVNFAARSGALAAASLARRACTCAAQPGRSSSRWPATCRRCLLPRLANCRPRAPARTHPACLQSSPLTSI
jgi:hypothetical protein